MAITLRIMAKRRPAALSIRPEEYTVAKARADSLGLNFSAYINSLIRADVQRGGNLIMEPITPPSQPLPPREDVDYHKTTKKK